MAYTVGKSSVANPNCWLQLGVCKLLMTARKVKQNVICTTVTLECSSFWNFYNDWGKGLITSNVCVAI